MKAFVIQVKAMGFSTSKECAMSQVKSNVCMHTHTYTHKCVQRCICAHTPDMYKQIYIFNCFLIELQNFLSSTSEGTVSTSEYYAISQLHHFQFT